MRKNTNVSDLPLIARLGVQKMATKCSGACGACQFYGTYGKETCAIMATEEKGN